MTEISSNSLEAAENGRLSEDVDVIIVGAGLSGIGAAWHLQDKCPDKRYLILEGRETMGGTWDLFKYPGIRSDSDMYTLGYSFKPWTDANAIATGPTILNYIKETAAEAGIDQHIRYSMHVEKAEWSSDNSTWTVTATNTATGASETFTCNFLFMCSGYYNYAEGYQPDFEGLENFKGEFIHPQFWPEEMDYSGKRMVVIGSGATAVTLVPELAKQAAHVTMLQRSPTYMAARPREDKPANWLKDHAPAKLAYQLIRWRNVLMGAFFFRLCRSQPEKVASMLIDGVKSLLPAGFDVKKHFTPSYNPWDQRLCLVTDGDLFTAIKEGRADVVTDHIDHFTDTGIKLTSGDDIEADVVVSATGLKLQLLSGVDFVVDGELADFSSKLTYKGMMFSGVPNMALSMGYTNASWTLKCDLTCEYACRLMNYMDKRGFTESRPENHKHDLELEPFLDFNSSYVMRDIDQFPKQATEKPWKLNQNYLLDLMTLGFGSIEDDAMMFRGQPKRRVEQTKNSSAALTESTSP